jgi:fucose permease
MGGRLLAQLLLPIVSHKKMLLVSVAGAMTGYLLLSLTGSMVFAFIAAIIVGFSHAPIYPLITERLDDRFSYHPGFYTGAISFAMAGATATPWLLGYVAESLGMRAVMLVPAIASIAVLILSILIMVESRLMSGKQDDAHQGLLGSDK